MKAIALFLFPLLAFSNSLTELAKLAPSGLITLTDKTYPLVSAFPRNHTVIVVLTALSPQFGCQVCQSFDPEFKILASSWSKTHRGKPNNMFFAQLDLMDGKETFRTYDIRHAPNLWIYTPNEANPIQYVFQQDSDAKVVAKFISIVTGESVQVIRPFNYNKLFVVIAFIITTASLVKFFWNPVIRMVGNRNFWAMLSLFAIVVFTSGQMFNQIRGTPYLVSNGKGGVNYIADGFSSQFGLESQIICIIYIFLALALAKLTFDVPKKRTEREQNLGVFIWLGTIWFVTSILLNIFHMKNTGYPFRLLL